MAFPKIYSPYNPNLIVATGTAATELEFGADPGIDGSSPSASGGKTYNLRSPAIPSEGGEMAVMVEIISGTFKMSVGNDPSSSPLSMAVGDKFMFTVKNGSSNLVFVAAAAGNSFTISV